MCNGRPCFAFPTVFAKNCVTVFLKLLKNLYGFVISTNMSCNATAMLVNDCNGLLWMVTVTLGFGRYWS